VPDETTIRDLSGGEPLDRDAVIEVVTALTNDTGFKMRDAEYESMRQLVFCRPERAPQIPGIDIDPKLAYMSPEIEVDGHLYKRRMLEAQMNLSVRAKAEGPKAEAAAAKIKAFLKWHYEEWRAAMVFDGPLFHMATVGCGVLRPMIDWDAVPDPPEYNEGESPRDYLKRASDHLRSATGTIFRLESVDYATVYHEWDWSVAVQQARVPLPVLNRIAAAKGKRVTVDDRRDEGSGLRVRVHELSGQPGVNESLPGAWNGDVKLVVMDDGKHIYTFVYADAARNGELLDVIPNVWGECSFVPLPGDVTGEPHPLYGYQPLLVGKYRLVPIKNLLSTILMVAGVRAGQHRYQVVWRGPGEPPDDGEAVEVVIEDEVLKLSKPGYAIEAPKLDLGFDVAAALAHLQAMDRYGYPEELARPGEIKASSGYERARITDTIASTLDPPLEHFAAVLRRIFLMMLNAIKVLDIPVTVRTARKGGSPETPTDVMDEITLEPSDLVDVDIRVSFDSMTQFSLIAQQEEGLKLRAQGLKTDSEVLTQDRGIEDVQGWYRLKARDEIRAFVRQKAIEDAKAAIDAIRSLVVPRGLDKAGVDPSLRAQAGITTPEEDLQGTSIPTGPGSGMPIVPPQPEELEQPTMQSAGEVGVGLGEEFGV
jgi:hypothetical protein